jgi:hemin uptake protein HemP
MGHSVVVAMSEHDQPQPVQSASEAKLQPREVRNWSSEQLLGSSTEAHIVHGNEVYRLLRTRNDKLILVK